MAPVREALRELAGLAGQHDAAAVLELQIGEVMTRTTVVDAAGGEYLEVQARLPASRRSPMLGPRPGGLEPDELPAGAATISWDEESGCYLATRRVAVAEIRDERELMDAILTTADVAIGWLDLIEKLPLG